MNIKILTEPISKQHALEIGKEFYTEMVKGVVDIEKKVIALGGEYHIDANTVLIENGSSQSDVWGFNLYPGRLSSGWIEYTSLINIRPAAGNLTMVVADEKIKQAMKEIIEQSVI